MAKPHLDPWGGVGGEAPHSPRKGTFPAFRAEQSPAHPGWWSHARCGSPIQSIHPVHQPLPLVWTHPDETIANRSLPSRISTRRQLTLISLSSATCIPLPRQLCLTATSWTLLYRSFPWPKLLCDCLSDFADSNTCSSQQ